MAADYGDLLDTLAIFKKLRIRILKEISSGEEGLSVTDISVFSRVCKAEGELTMTDISAATAYSNAIITLSVDQLEMKGLVKRIRGDDRRRYIIIPTEKGAEKYIQIKSAQDRVVKAIFGKLSENEQERLSAILSELKALLGRHL